MNTRDSDGSQLEFGDDESTVALRRAWDRAVRALTPNLTRTSQAFLAGTCPLSIAGGLVVLGAPSRFAREWLERRYAEALRSQLASALERPDLRVRFVIAPPSTQRPVLALPVPACDGLQNGAPVDETGALVPAQAGPPVRSAARPVPKPKPLPAELSLPLSPKLTFETFIVGKSNRLAHAGAMAVAQSPGSAYNPLFLYGSPGLGKTHLMHAIGHAVAAERPGMRVAYTSGEMFLNSYIAALRENRSDQFRAAYRSVDLWLVDDIQAIAGGKHTKEEFFHTFNTLHQTGKQIVLSADKPPRELRMMDERLSTRFESGLTADIAAPEVEMRVAILQQKAHLDGLDAPADVLHYMASMIQSNIRTLEGALIRLSVYASVTNSPMTCALAREVLGGYFVERRKLLAGASPGDADSADERSGFEDRSPLREMPIPAPGGRLAALQFSEQEKLQRIVVTVADHFGIDPALLAGDGSAATSRRLEVAAPRRIAVFLAREKTSLPVSEIGRLFGGVDHSAISHAHKKLGLSLQSDPKVLSAVQAIKRRLDLP